MAETLELQIKTTADQAAKSIGNLENKLRSLGGALSSINGSNLHNFSSGLSELSKSVRGLSSIDTRTFSKVAQNMQKLGNLDTARLVSSAAALGNMSKQLASFAGISKQSDNIVQVTKAISKLGSKSAENAANNIRELGTSLKQTLTTLSTAPTVSKNIIEMTNALARLASQGSKVQSASKSITSTFNNISTQSEGLKSKLSGLTKSTSSTGGGFKGLASTLGKFYATYWMVIRATSKLRDAVDLSSQLTEVQNVVDTTFGNMAGKLDEFTETSIQDFGMSELTAKQTASRFQAMGSAMGITSAQVANGTKLINDKLAETKDTAYSSTQSLADMSLNLTKLTADIASFYDKDQAEVAEDLSAIYTGMVVPLRKYGLDLTQATLSEWAMANGLDSDVKSMTQAEKTMLRYQYVMANTTAAQGDFAKTADTWANSVRTLKQEFQAWGSIIGGTIINALKPLVRTLNAVMLKVISFTQTVANALGAIFGWTVEISGAGALDDTMSDAADSAGGIADSTGDAAKNVKDMVNGARKFDELNIISLNKDSGKGEGGGSGSGAGAGGGTKSSLKKVDGLVEKYKSSIKNLYDLGAYIGKTITDSLNSIDWKSVYRAADNFGTGLAEFLNGLISPELFGALGRTIAGALNTVLHALDSFGEKFDWTKFGESIASGINNFFSTFDFKLLGKTISVWAIGICTSLATALRTTDFGMIGDSIADGIAAINTKGIGWHLGDLVSSFVNSFYILVSNKRMWSNLGTKIADGINGFFESMNSVDSRTGLTGWQALGKNISTTISGFADTIVTALNKVDWVKVGQGIGDFFASIDWAAVTWDLTKLVVSFGKALTEALWGWFKEDPLSATIVAGFGLAKLTGLSGTLADVIKGALGTGGFPSTGTTGKGGLPSTTKDKIAGVGLAGSGLLLETQTGKGGLEDALAPVLTGLGLSKIGFGTYALPITIVMTVANLGLSIGNQIAGTDKSWSDLKQDVDQATGDTLLDSLHVIQEWWNAPGGMKEMISDIAGGISKTAQNATADFKEGWAKGEDEWAKKSKNNTDGVKKRYTDLEAGVSKNLSNVGSRLKATGGKSTDFADAVEYADRHAADSISDMYKKAHPNLSKLGDSFDGLGKKGSALQGGIDNNKTSILRSLSNMFTEGGRSLLNLGNSSDTTGKKFNTLQGTASDTDTIVSKHMLEMKNSSNPNLGAIHDKANELNGKISGLSGTAATTAGNVGQSLLDMKKNSNPSLVSVYNNADGVNGKISGLSGTAATTAGAVSNSLLDMKKGSNPSLFSVYNNANGLGGSIGGLATTAGTASASVSGSIGDMKKSSNASLYSTYNNVNGLKGATDNLRDAVKTPFYIKATSDGLTNIKNGIDGITASLDSLFEYKNKSLGITTGLNGLGHTSLLDIAGYATGGFPDQYSMFMAGENGKAEMLGTVGGRTAVAGGAEITGIREAILDTAQQQIAYMGQEIELLTGILNKQYGISKSDIGKASRDYAKDYKNRTGRDAYAF